jgi:hypothetical protein
MCAVTALRKGGAGMRSGSGLWSVSRSRQAQQRGAFKSRERESGSGLWSMSCRWKGKKGGMRSMRADLASSCNCQACLIRQSEVRQLFFRSMGLMTWPVSNKHKGNDNHGLKLHTQYEVKVAHMKLGSPK